jgi:hypothetical protein
MRLEGLTTLSLNGTAITDAGIEDIARLKGLSILSVNDIKLNLSGVLVGADGLSMLRMTLPGCEIVP